MKTYLHLSATRGRIDNTVSTANSLRNEANEAVNKLAQKFQAHLTEATNMIIEELMLRTKSSNQVLAMSSNFMALLSMPFVF
jgi:hypothetical protein